MGYLIEATTPVLQRGIHYVTSPFGMRTLNGKTSMHYGIDLVSYLDGATTIDYVIAYADGIVIANGFDNERGYYLQLDHGTYKTIYQHFKYASILQVGQPVKKGWVISLMGSSGKSTAAHLHFGVSVDEQWVDPLPYLVAEQGEAWSWALAEGIVATNAEPTKTATFNDVVEMLYKLP